MRGLTCYITDLVGNHLALVKAIPAPQGGNQTTVHREANGAATASVRVSARDATCVKALQARNGTRMLKVYYLAPGQEDPVLAVWAVIRRPIARMSQGVIEVTATDATARARKAFAALYGKPGGTGVSIDGVGVEDIWLAQINTDISIGAAHAGVVALGGRHGTTHPSYEAAIADGQSFQDFIDTVSDAVDGPDWELRPLDTTLGEAPIGMSSAAWTTLRTSTPFAFTSQLHTYDRMARDLTKTVFFGFGTAPSNLADLEIEEAGDQTVNVAFVSITGAAAGTTPAVASDFASVLEVGPQCSLTSLGTDGEASTSPVAQQTADAQVKAYKFAPIFLTLTVMKDELARFHPWVDFQIGDFITVAGESGFIQIPYQGAWVKKVPARITAIDLKEDAQGRVSQTLTVVVGDYEED